MAIRLRSEALRVVKKNDRGAVTYRKRYRRGDKIDVAHLAEGRLETLLASGALYDDNEEQATPDADAVRAALESTRAGASVGAGLGTGVPFNPDEEDETDADEDEGEKPETPTVFEVPLEPEAKPVDDGQVGELIPDLDNMSYPDLQALAKEKVGNAAGGKQDLIERLTQYYTS